MEALSNQENGVDHLLLEYSIYSSEDQEKHYLLAVFPQNIWLNILESVDNPDILVNVSQASSFWRSILQEERARFMFPQVLNILRNENFLNHNDCSLLLQLRLVCKFWKIGVDRFLETRSDHKNLEFESLQQSITSDFANSIYFRLYSPETLKILAAKILPALETETCRNNNPFPSRHLQISEKVFPFVTLWRTEMENLLVYRATTERLLQTAGHHFWYADIQIGASARPWMKTEDWYNLVSKYLKFMPNLRSLYINCPERMFTGTDYLKEVPPFPTLKYLELLSMEGVPKCAIPFILSANKHIKVLILPDACVYFKGTITEKAASGMELDPLDISAIESPDTLSIYFPSFADMTILSSDLKLRVLRMKFPASAYISWLKIFERLETLKEGLSELYLELPKATIAENKLELLEASKRMLYLPRLKIFQVTTENYCSLDFLLGLKGIESLSLHLINYEWWSPVNRSEIGTGAQIIDFKFGLPQKFMECNIWTLLPTLKNVQLQIDNGRKNKYKRGCYPSQFGLQNNITKK